MLYDDPNQEVVYRILELLPTIEEAFLHINDQLTELRLEESERLFTDAMRAISNIAGNLARLAPRQDETGLIQDTAGLREAIGLMIDGYETGKLETLPAVLTGHLLPAFRVWRRQVEKMVQPAILS